MFIRLTLSSREAPEPRRARIDVIPTKTDNRGSGSALTTLMTTRFSSRAVLMKLAAVLKKQSIHASVEWSPRTANMCTRTGGWRHEWLPIRPRVHRRFGTTPVVRLGKGACDWAEDRKRVQGFRDQE